MDTDKRVQTDVMSELKWEPSIDAAHIGASVEGGAVTLTGHVPNYYAKTRAVQAAERVYAVRAVADELEVQLPTSDHHDDSSIAKAITDNFKWNVAVPQGVEAKVAKGWVTLSGEVDSNYEREAASRAVSYHAGVRGVFNEIAVKKHKSASDISKLIDSAFHRNATLDARRVRVTTDGGAVKLYGNVHSLDEMRTARHAAYAAPGVTSVDNHILVTP
jgi:osmotically-inducible protein OsmY